jgi:hypothetical protein
VAQQRDSKWRGCSKGDFVVQVTVNGVGAWTDQGRPGKSLGSTNGFSKSGVASVPLTRDRVTAPVILGRLSFINLPKKALLSVHEAWRQECLISRITHQKLKSPIDSLPCSFHILIDIRNYSGNIFRKATAKGGLQETTLSTRTYAKGLPAWNFKFIAYTSNIYKA